MTEAEQAELPGLVGYLSKVDEWTAAGEPADLVKACHKAAAAIDALLKDAPDDRS